MKIDFLSDDGRGRTALIARTETGDAVPAVDCLLMDAAPLEIDYDRVALAACLIFGGSSDKLEFGWPVSPRLAGAISSSIGCRVSSLIVERDDMVEAIQATRLQVTLSLTIPSGTPPRDCTRLTIVPSERFYGSLHGVKEAIVGSNAWLLTDYVSEAYVMAAVGALYSRDFLASAVEISGLEALSSSELMVIRELYRSVDLGLESVGGH